MSKPFTTIGMASWGDLDGVQFTVQSLRLHHDLTDCEILVVDNQGNPALRQFCEGWGGCARYVLANEVQGTAYPRERVFQEARGEAVLCLDCHVLLPAGVIPRLISYYREHPGCNDLLQGPWMYDDLYTLNTHFEPEWREEMWGVCAPARNREDVSKEPFSVWGQGLGLFSMRRDAWPGFNSAFRGFGGEEGCLHEKVRQRGGRILCLPWLQWWHHFRAQGEKPPYSLLVEDKCRNYLLGHKELGLDARPVIEHFRSRLPAPTLRSLIREVFHEQAAICR